MFRNTALKATNSGMLRGATASSSRRSFHLATSVQRSFREKRELEDSSSRFWPNQTLKRQIHCMLYKKNPAMFRNTALKATNSGMLRGATASSSRRSFHTLRDFSWIKVQRSFREKRELEDSSSRFWPNQTLYVYLDASSFPLYSGLLPAGTTWQYQADSIACSESHCMLYCQPDIAMLSLQVANRNTEERKRRQGTRTDLARISNYYLPIPFFLENFVGP
jgi:hypothetical protein